MPARQEPRVDAEPHGGPPAVTDPDRFRPQPPELGQALLIALFLPELLAAPMERQRAPSGYLNANEPSALLGMNSSQTE
jgi:hypothetical protein